MLRPHAFTVALAVGGLGLGLVLPAGCNRGAARSVQFAPRRHVLLISVDTLRADYVGHTAYGLPTTPFADSLRAGGFQFTRAITPIPRTTQALASLLTGCYPHTTQVRRLWSRLAPEVVSLAQMAQAGGYATVAVVSNQVLARRRGLARGFDVYDHAPDTRGATGTTDAAIGHLGKLTRQQSIFAWVHYIDPHVPYFPPPELAEQFDPTYQGRYRLHFGTIQGGPGDLAYPIDLPKAEAVYRNPLPEEVNAHIRRLYAADVRHADDQIARLVTWVRETLGDDWLIVFTADHGESLGEHNYYYDHGDYVYEPGLRIPLVFVFPPGDALSRPGACDDWVSLVDVMPTLAELLGLPLPAGKGYAVEGQSLVPCMRGERPAAGPRFAECGRCLFPYLMPRRVHFDVAGRFRAVVSGDWKLIWTPGQTPDQEYELYDVRSDPLETRDLYTPDHPQVERLKGLLHGWVRITDEESGGPSRSDIEALKALGYIEETEKGTDAGGGPPP